jgi:hypothetical protein
MKSLIGLPAALLLAGCCTTNPDTLEYRQVAVTPCCNSVRVTPCCNRAPMATCCNRVTVYNEEPIDVTTTAIDYY